ncbi:MAG: von Willebrand factor type A domain-containing protein, partial [Bacteroidota bacterium]
MTKNIVLTLNLLFLSTFLVAQTTLTGKVTDAESGEELIGANVQVFRNGAFVVGDATDIDGNFSLRVDPGTYDIDFSYTGYPTQKVEGVIAVASHATKVDVQLQTGTGQVLDEIVVTGYKVPLIRQDETSSGGSRDVAMPRLYYIDGVRVSGNLIPESEIEQIQIIQGGLSAAYSHPDEVKENPNKQPTPIPFKETPPQKKKVEKEVAAFNEEYETIVENEFLSAIKTPLSTFSIDVDNAAYSNVRRYLNNHQMPPKNAVRIEEFINYFDYDYPQPSNVDPFSINTEISDCPWNPDHKLVHIGLQGCDLPKENMPPSNLVFLLDVSGSMSYNNKLPLVKKSFKLLVQQLREEDKVS